MDVLKPSSEKKKKKVTKRRALEIKRRRSSILQNAANLNEDQLDSIARGDLGKRGIMETYTQFTFLSLPSSILLKLSGLSVAIAT